MSWTLQQLADLQRRRTEGEQPKAVRSNHLNTGKSYEKLFEMTAAAYERKGLLLLRKVDPPVKFIAGRAIFLANPYLDYIGSWSERGGRLLCLEVKSTSKPSLTLEDSQRAAAVRWHEFGAVVAIIWYRFDCCRIAWPEQIAIRSPMHWQTLEEVRPGTAGVVFDWLENLRWKYRT
jgi:hypothetical protein